MNPSLQEPFKELLFTLTLSSWKVAQCSTHRSEVEMIYAACVGVCWKPSTNFSKIPKADAIYLDTKHAEVHSFCAQTQQARLINESSVSEGCYVILAVITQ